MIEIIRMINLSINFIFKESHLVIYDVLGRQVRTLVNQDLTAGYHRAVWDATDDLGRPLSGGLYIYRIKAGGFVQTKKMVLLK